ncbi:MAG: deoxyguanosinetriphosphate triphosphohydrolase, partial [Actinobacteria bacterium]|nr:deoxyguanosinetriphosphate triphosphohydrolase [Actinomycetota bacterium]
LVAPHELPAEVVQVVGADRRTQLHGFITAMVDTIATTGTVGLREPEAGALAAFRAFNYERIYLRPEAVDQADRAARLIAALAEHFLTDPQALPDGAGLAPGSPEATAAAVRYVSGMTDRFAHRCALDLLGWSPSALPRTV